MSTPYTPDPWDQLRRFTSARIALGRAGTSVPTRELLSFQMNHARAVDAVYAELDRDALAEELGLHTIDTVHLDTLADTRQDFLQRPDHGRKLNATSVDSLRQLAAADKPADVTIAVVDGLSATAIHANATPVILGLRKKLKESGLSLSPVPLVRYGRVALQDEIGSILGSRIVVSLIGERPGLGAPDSLGAYLVFDPKTGNTDANRNCVSNIRPEGLGHEAAVDTLLWLITEMVKRKISGVELKDDRQVDTLSASATTPELT